MRDDAQSGETSQFLTGALKTLRSQATTMLDLAATLRTSVPDLREHLFGLVVM
jgi:hypothetical protein